MLNISELHEASLIMDIAAVFLLIGTIIYTTIYRKRGHIDDKLFFYLIVDTLVMAISDGITYVSAVFPLECAALNGRTAADVDWNSVASSDFRPALDELDFYIRSIVIE